MAAMASTREDVALRTQPTLGSPRPFLSAQTPAKKKKYLCNVGDGQGGLASCSPWGRKESDTTANTLHPVSLPRAGSQALATHSPDENTEAVRAQALARSKSQACRPVASGVSRPGLCRSTRLAPDPRRAGSSEGIAGLWAEDTWPAGPRRGFLLLILSSG